MDSNDPLHGMNDSRLPGLPDSAQWADWLLGIGIGVTCAVLVAVFAGLVFQRRPVFASTALIKLDQSRTQEPENRLFAQGVVLRDIAQKLKIPEGENWLHDLGRKLKTDIFETGSAAELRQDLYRANPGTDPDVLDAEMTRLLTRMRG